MKLLLAILTALLFLCAQTLAADAPKPKPNIIFVLFDDMGYGQGASEQGGSQCRGPDVRLMRFERSGSAETRADGRRDRFSFLAV